MSSIRSRARAHAVALGLSHGKTAVDACLDAGYSAKTAKANAHVIVRRRDVYVQLQEIGRSITRQDMSSMASARLADMLSDNGTPPSALVSAIRLAKEMAGEIGSGRDATVHHQLEIPVAVQEIMARRMIELQAADQAKKELTVDAPESTVIASSESKD